MRRGEEIPDVAHVLLLVIYVPRYVLGSYCDFGGRDRRQRLKMYYDLLVRVICEIVSGLSLELLGIRSPVQAAYGALSDDAPLPLSLSDMAYALPSAAPCHGPLNSYHARAWTISTSTRR